jgi:hypothetical protein
LLSFLVGLAFADHVHQVTVTLCAGVELVRDFHVVQQQRRHPAVLDFWQVLALHQEGFRD